MINLNDYLLYKEITSNNEASIYEAGNDATASYEDGVIFIEAKYVGIGIPLEGISVLNQKKKPIIKGKELQPLADKYAEGDMEGAVEELYKLLEEHSEELIDPKEIKEAVEQPSDGEGDEGDKSEEHQQYNFTLQIENAQLWPPQGKKLKEAGIILYLDFNVSLLVKNPQPSLQDFKINEIHFEGIGKEVLVPILKKVLGNCDAYIDLLLVFFNAFDKKSGKNQVNGKVLNSKMKNEMNKSVKDNIDDIKKAPQSEENDSQASELTEINA